ncbi:hypothetical protein SAMN04488042_11443 [Shimia aestuarii]|uniref:Uncharacterized protein n=1 Tax=Shimia aestuarii TaxID=254406 RepID=A0A1I4T998_9RHOB|nr:hypothetical protein SAMN04488042_11443 [Shimia aestuarii]
MSLMLHAGAEAVDYDVLRQLPTPESTPTHVPIAHCAGFCCKLFAIDAQERRE